jgi:hypothetical protein
MDGVAHTFGSATHKEIHMSLDHIRNCKDRAGHEICGVLTHEMVHAFQYDGGGNTPGTPFHSTRLCSVAANAHKGGLIEGVAGACARFTSVG